MSKNKNMKHITAQQKLKQWVWWKPQTAWYVET